MEANMGKDGGHGGPSWSSSWSSSLSGTIVSTAYTSSSSASRLSSASIPMGMGMGAAMHLHYFRTREETDEVRVQSLAREFLGGAPPPANCSCSIIKGGDMISNPGALQERWFTELGVGWLLHLANASGVVSACEPDDHPSSDDDARSWIHALHEITEAIRSMASADRGGSMGGLPSICEQGEEPAEADRHQGSVPELLALSFARFIQETMLKMLAFVDSLVALDATRRVPALHRKIRILLRVHGALSDALSEIKVLFLSTLSPEVQRIRVGMVNLLYANNAKARESIRSTLQEIRTRIMGPTREGEDSPESSDIHKLTLSVMAHITFLLHNYSPMDPIVSEATILGKYVPRFRYIPPLDSMIMEMASCLEERLLDMSESFPDQGLRFLFLLNNSDFIRRSLQGSTMVSSVEVHVAALFEKIKDYTESYLQVSWAPVLSCLFTLTPLCLFGKKYSSQLPKFESDFQKMYSTQKMWKVPDPELRNKLRQAVTEKIVPGYTKYIEDNNVTNPKSTPQNLEEMLQELFEG